MRRKNTETLIKKILCLSSSAFILSNSFAPFVYAESNLFQQANDEDIKILKNYFTTGQSNVFLPMNLLEKDFSLNKYEVLLMSELIKQDIEKRVKNENEKNEALRDLVDLQNKYKEEYKELFNHIPSNIIEESNNIVDSDKFVNFPSQDASIQDYINMINQNTSPPSGDDFIDKTKKNIENSNSPEELADNMSLINIRKNPSSDANISIKVNSKNPRTEFESLEDLSKIQIVGDVERPLPSTFDESEKDSLRDLVRLEAERSISKSKQFFISAIHNLYYVDEGGDGNIPLNKNKTDDSGNYYAPAVTNQYQLEESIDIGLGFRIHKAVDMIVGLVAKNENGSVFSPGTKWDFGNVMFKFHPERLSGMEIQKLKTEGIDIQDGGRYIGKTLGHGVSIGTDTKTGDLSARINGDGTAINYSKNDGVSLAKTSGKYFLGFGKLSLNLSSYTLQLSDCKAIEVGYNDKDNSFLFLYGKPNSRKDGYEITNSKGVVTGFSKGTYDRRLYAMQYVARNFLPNMEIAFNFANSWDQGHLLKDPRDASPKNTSVYSVAIQSKRMQNTSFSGEFAHSRVETLNKKERKIEYKSGNADYLDISHKFSDRLTGNFHFINIDGTFDSSSLVEDKTGEDLLTTNTGDGIPDYLYKAGQRGMDITLDYIFPDSDAAIAFGYSRYSKTTEFDSTKNRFNEKTNLFLGISKTWNLGNGTLAAQQRFEYNNVSKNDYSQKVSDTTISYQGEPWENGEVASDFQKIIDNADGNQTRFDLTVAHNFYPLERVSIKPQVEYQYKKGEKGLNQKSTEIDSTILINSLTVGYELIPDELRVNLLISKEKYNIISSEIDEATNAKIDGEKRDVFGTGIGLIWEPKKIEGLSLGVSYRKDKVHYYTPLDETSSQDVWQFTASYDKAISDTVRASIAYDYKSARDKAKPIYDAITRTVEIDVNANINEDQVISLKHSYESEYKPLNPEANHKMHTTVISMTNKF